MVRWRAVGLLVIGLVLVIAGCSTPRRTITGSEAIQRLDDYLRQAVDAAPSGLRVVREKAEATYGGGCTRGLSDSDFTGQVEAEVNYEVSDVPPDVAAQYLDALARLWKLKWGPADRSRDRVDVQIDEGKFRLYGVYSSGARRVGVGGTSGCIWVNGTPGPNDKP